MTTVVLEPLRDLVLVRLRPLPEKTGSIIRVQRNEIARKADVLAVGPEVRDVKVGWGVVVNPLAGQEVGEGLLLPESSVMAYL